MKKVIFCLLILFFGSNVFSQEINKLKPGFTVRKGRIALGDGNLVKFKHLTLKNDLITYSDIAGKTCEKRISEVYKISKSGNNAGTIALLGGVVGLAAVLQVKNEEQPGTIEAEYPMTAGFAIGAVASCVALGGVIGAFIKKEKPLYLNKSTLSIYPSASPNINGKSYALITLKINLY